MRGGFGTPPAVADTTVPASVVSTVNGQSGDIEIRTQPIEEEKSSDFSAQYGYIYYCDATNGPISVTAPGVVPDSPSFTLVKVDSTANPVIFLGDVNGLGHRSLTELESVELRARAEGFQVI